jgi:hypothetical protein
MRKGALSMEVRLRRTPISTGFQVRMCFGNQVAPSNEYQPLGLTSGYNNLTGTASTDWPNAHAAALNAADNSAYNVRTNATLPVYVFTIGLGGNDGNPPGSHLAAADGKRSKRGSVQQSTGISCLLRRTFLHQLPQPAAGHVHLFAHFRAAWPGVPGDFVADPALEPLAKAPRAKQLTCAWLSI